MVYNILDFGAKEGAGQLNTSAIQAAIDACAAAGGGRVTVPCGLFVTGTLWLKSNIELHLEHGATLKASSDLSNYNNTSDYPQNFDFSDEGWCGKHLLIAVGQENIALSGTGRIDGSGDAFFSGPLRRFSNYCWGNGYYTIEDGAALRPGQMICFVECQHITARDVTLQNSPCWNLLLHGCDHVSVSGLRIYADKQHANTDGIDLDCCSYVTVSNCIIDVGDDCIAIRGNSEKLTDPKKECKYITVSNCILSCSACAVRIGVGFSAIHHICLSDLVIPQAGTGLSMQTDFSGWGNVPISEISFHHVTGEDVGRPLEIYAIGTTIKNVVISDYSCGCKASCKIDGKNRSISDLVLRNVSFYDREHTYTMPKIAQKERSPFMLNIAEVERAVLDHVRFYIRNNYFEERSNMICSKNVGYSMLDCKYIYRTEEYIGGVTEPEED